jgi:hypothetical protein
MTRDVLVNTTTTYRGLMLCRSKIFSREGVWAGLIRRFLDWMIGFIDTLHTVIGTTGNYSATADIHTLQFTVTHALGFSVFTSRILATDLSQSHCYFKSPMKSSFHSLIPFLLLFCNCQFRRLNSIQSLCSYPGRLASRNSTLHFLLLFYTAEHSFITTLHGPWRKHSLCC